MMMDNGSGLDLTTQMRMSEKFKNMPILMISSMAEATFILKCIQAGIDDYIVKPWESEDLVKKIYQICQKRGLT
jgi:DNA-binding response OmpR family regulator